MDLKIAFLKIAIHSISQEMNVGICGSEIVGLVPLKSMLSAADYYIKKENLFILDEKHKVRLVC